MKKTIACLLTLILLATGFALPAHAATSATYSTGTYASSSGRLGNMKRAMNAIDGTVVPAGGSFSFNAVVGERTRANGYVSAVNDRGVKVMGGGVSQTATTLYLALLNLNAGMIAFDDVTFYGAEFTAGYISDGDYAVVTDYRAGTDFCFTNRTSKPIAIEMTHAGNTLTCTVYQMEASNSGKPTDSALGVVEQPFGSVSFFSVYPNFVFYDMPSPAATSHTEGWCIGDWLLTAGCYSFEVINCRTYVSLRKEADKKSDRIVKVGLGEVGYAIGYSGNWTLCYVNGRYGWIQSGYLYITDPNEYDCGSDEWGAPIYLDPDEVTAYASSTLTDAYGTYPASNACDGDETTTWSEGVSGNGIGQAITFSFDSAYLAGFAICGGFQKDSNRYYKNSRPKQLNVYVDGDFQGTVTLEDAMDVQYFDFDSPVYARTLSLEIVSVYPGSKCTDTCISEVYIFAY